MSERAGISQYAVYLPRFALATTRFGDASPAGRKQRSAANHDEDALTLAVEAARNLDIEGPIFFATSEPPYLDKSSGSTLHAALELPERIAAHDLVGLRAGSGAFGLAASGGGTAVLADLRTPAPGSPDELAHGDGAAAFTFSAEGAGAALVGSASATRELLDRWRLPGERHPVAWDERFTAEVYLGLMADAAGRALADAGLERTDRVVVSCANPRAASAARTALAGDGSDAALESQIGHTGTAHLGILLADAFDQSSPGESILALGAADGADAFVFVAGENVGEANRGPRVREQLASRTALTYDRYLRRRRLLDLQGARRPDPASPAAPPMLRRSHWKLGLVASCCSACGTVVTPPGPVCPGCGAVGTGEAYSLRDRGCTVVSFTADHLSPTPDPPVVLAVVDIDGGGRRSVEVTDVPESGIEVGDRLTPTFRRVHSAGGIHNYFWKAQPEVR